MVGLVSSSVSYNLKFENYSNSHLTHRLANFTEVIQGFSQSFQANSGIVQQSLTNCGGYILGAGGRQ
jgi:hypothetical protein